MSQEKLMQYDVKVIRYEIKRMPQFPLNPNLPRWRCYDRLTHCVGYGETPTHAQYDCQIELEILTSDIHK